MTGSTAPTVTTDRIRGWLWWVAVANLVANIGIVVTGGAVRLTGSGLGCPTWPRCTEESYTPHDALGVHGAIEFGNRLLTFAVGLVALGCLVLAVAVLLRARAAGTHRPADRRAVVLSGIVLAGVPLQAVIGGITVWTDLNPYVVALHLLASMAMIGVCVWLLDVLRGPHRPAASAGSTRLAWLTFAAGWVALWLGTVVTGSGPHSGDLESRRTGLDPQVVSHVHGVSVWLLVALTVALTVVARRAGETWPARFAAILLGVELAQGVLGYVQYVTDLPELLVGLHMLGAALVAAGMARVVVTTRAR